MSPVDGNILAAAQACRRFSYFKQRSVQKNPNTTKNKTATAARNLVAMHLPKPLIYGKLEGHIWSILQIFCKLEQAIAQHSVHVDAEPEFQHSLGFTLGPPDASSRGLCKQEAMQVPWLCALQGNSWGGSGDVPEMSKKGIFETSPEVIFVSDQSSVSTQRG